MGASGVAGVSVLLLADRLLAISYPVTRLVAVVAPVAVALATTLTILSRTSLFLLLAGSCLSLGGGVHEIGCGVVLERRGLSRHHLRFIFLRSKFKDETFASYGRRKRELLRA